MNDSAESDEETKSSIKIHDVLVSFFKHKWKLIICVLVGFGAAAAVWFTHVTVYESRAKVFVKYVPVWHPDQEKVLSNYDESYIQPEIEILSSWDIASAVVAKIGIDRIVTLPPGPANASIAAGFVMKNREVIVTKGSKVIEVVFKHPNAETAVLVLNEILAQYELMHDRVHHPKGIFETMDRQRSEIQGDLAKIEQRLKEMKGKANINNLSESATSINTRMNLTQMDLQGAQIKLASQKARVAALEKLLGVAATENSEKDAAVAVAPPDPLQVQEYQTLLQRREGLRAKEDELLTRLEPRSSEVQAIRGRINIYDLELAKLRKAMPSLNSTPVASVSGSGDRPKMDLTAERAELRALEAQHSELESAYNKVRSDWDQFREVAPGIDALEREKIRQDNLLASKQVSIVNARIQALDDGKNMANIDIIQKPSPPVPSTDKLMKIVLGIAAGSVVLGLGLAFLCEFVLDQSVRQPLELETRLGIPLLMAIPEQAKDAARRLGKGKGGEIVPWQEGHFIRPFAEAIRDRLVLHFEQSGLIRKPKLVGVTGWTAGAGTSTLASGLAAALSETGDGKVLLVDMNVRGGQVHPFFKGEAAALLPDALLSSENVHSAATNLYIATATTQNGETEIIPKRFYNMIPNFKASDYDYIIFDMPLLSKGSMTLAMAGFMDRTLLVVEAEKDNRNILKRACSELVQAKANLCGVLNKVRSYGPGWLKEA